MEYCSLVSHLSVVCHPGSHPLVQRPSTGSQAEVPRQCPQDSEQVYPYVPGVHSTIQFNMFSMYICNFHQRNIKSK